MISNEATGLTSYVIDRYTASNTDLTRYRYFPVVAGRVVNTGSGRALFGNVNGRCHSVDITDVFARGVEGILRGVQSADPG